MVTNHAPPVQESLQRRTKLALWVAGWSGRRRCDTTEYAKILASRDVAVSSAALSVIERFGGLNVGFHAFSLTRFMSRQDFCIFGNNKESLEPFLCILPVPFEEYSLRVGSLLSPIGVIGWGAWLMMCDESGVIYATMGKQIRLVGNSINEALNQLVCRGSLMKEF